MDCLICKSNCKPYLSKRFDSYGLGSVKYARCEQCKAVFSETHMSMNEEEWEKLNTDYHSSYQGSAYNLDDPAWQTRLVAQANILVQMEQAAILRHVNPWLDWGCGDGKLSELLEERGCLIYNFDRYMAQGIRRYLNEDEVRPQTFDLVLSTSVFEHIRSLDTLDEMVSLLSDYGTLVFHNLDK